jgi:hypothetical protein
MMGVFGGPPSGEKEQIPAHPVPDDAARAHDASPTRAGSTRGKPTTVAQCTNGGWKHFGFPDYGACIVFVLSRPPSSRSSDGRSPRLLGRVSEVPRGSEPRCQHAGGCIDDSTGQDWAH